MLHANATSLVDGRYDRVTAEYYATLRELTAGTRYAALPAFYARRDREISRNILAALLAHPGKRVIIITGGDHHGSVIALLNRHSRNIATVPVEWR